MNDKKDWGESPEESFGNELYDLCVDRYSSVTYEQKIGELICVACQLWFINGSYADIVRDEMKVSIRELLRKWE